MDGFTARLRIKFRSGHEYIFMLMADSDLVMDSLGGINPNANPIQEAELTAFDGQRILRFGRPQ